MADIYTLVVIVNLKVQTYFFSSLLCHLLVLLLLSVFCDKPPSTCGQTACPHYTRPVCATNGRIRRTFNNQCAVRTFNECSSDESEWRDVNWIRFHLVSILFCRVQHNQERAVLKWQIILKANTLYSTRLLSASSSLSFPRVCQTYVIISTSLRLFHQTLKKTLFTFPIQLKINQKI